MNLPKSFIPLVCGIIAATAPVRAHAESYHVLTIRVEFPYEDPDHDTTSGRGEFDLRDYYAPQNDELRSQYFHPWDVPPHNRAYFEHHLLALDNYWRTVSEDRMNITADVYPRDPDSAYRMSKTFYKYGNGRTTEQTYQKLVDLLVEATAVCKDAEGDAVDFSAYDTIMVIHAGIGSETSGQLNDIPSAYISPDDILTYTGGPLVIDGNQVEHAIVVPEMTAANGIGGLNGIMAQMFGHRLGLPSMSNNNLGLPAAGGWCLMDTGAMSWGAQTRGFVPTHPSAWSKIALGWIKPLTVTADTTLSIAATHISGGLPRAVKVAITADEYFLIENRHNYAPRDSLATAVFSDSDSSGVWLRPGHYDAYIPGSGILVWHINDRIIRERRATGSVNDDPFRRGIDLVEADGRQDIGAQFGFGDPRAEHTEGHADDTYHTDGNDTLGPNTFPSSESLWGGRTGITIHVNSAIGDTMSVTISFDAGLAGFPATLPGAHALSAADLDGDGADELIVSGSDSAYIYTASGALAGEIPSAGHPAVGLLSSSDPFIFAVHGSELSRYRMADGNLVLDAHETAGDGQSIRFGQSSLLADPVSVSLVASGRSFASAGEPAAAMLVSPSFGPAAMPLVELPDTSAVTGLSMLGGQYAAVTGADNLFIGTAGAPPLQLTLSNADATAPLLIDTDRDGEYETVIATDAQLRFYLPDGSFESCALDMPPVGNPTAADIDGDGYPEVIIAAGRSVYAFRSGGVRAAGFPFGLPPGDETEIITTTPIIADIDDDGAPDIMAATSNMRIVAWEASGDMTPGFPMTIRGQAAAAPAIFRHGEGRLAIAYLTDTGMLMACDLDASATDTASPWPMERGGPGLSGAFPNERISAPVQRTASFEAICYPNPITGGTGTFRITPEEPTDCRIEVFTADGRMVFESYVPENGILPGVPNEIRMDASNLASGLYLARVKTRRETAIIKIGVLK